MKKAVTILVLAAVLVSSLAPCSLAAYEEEDTYHEVIAPRYEVINYIVATLEIFSSGRAVCDAAAETFIGSGYTVEVSAELQRKGGSIWSTIDEWSDSGYELAETAGYKYVLSGYSYRLKVTASVYDSDGSLVEARIKYSNVEEY